MKLLERLENAGVNKIRIRGHKVMSPPTAYVLKHKEEIREAMKKGYMTQDILKFLRDESGLDIKLHHFQYVIYTKGKRSKKAIENKQENTALLPTEATTIVEKVKPKLEPKLKPKLEPKLKPKLEPKLIANNTRNSFCVEYKIGAEHIRGFFTVKTEQEIKELIKKKAGIRSARFGEKVGYKIKSIVAMTEAEYMSVGK